MNVLFISECSKQALIETRRVLDQFAERRGQRVWQTQITSEGLKTVRKLLSKTARKNTAVACYSIYRKNHSELVWIVGNRKMFSETGVVPTNRTLKNVVGKYSENNLMFIQSVAILAAIAGLFHDFGKANLLFQQKLKGQAKRSWEMYRHEWLSAQFFKSFVGKRTDIEWLTDLRDGNFNNYSHLKISCDELVLEEMPPFARAVAYLLLSHHRLPMNLLRNVHFSQLDKFSSGIDATWNALNHLDKDWTESDFDKNLNIDDGLPWDSKTWRKKASEISNRALKQNNLVEFASLEQALTMHLARLILMLADHAYSSQNQTILWQDQNYKCVANTDQRTHQPKQKLDEHCVGVAHYAYLFAKMLPNIKTSLPAILQNKKLKQRVKNPNFRWQDKAYDEALAISEQTYNHGFFGVNLASTGKGKTFANARIMYALSEKESGVRFNVALGLRSLTLQTGSALREKLGLDESYVGIKIGSQAFLDLYEDNSSVQLNTGSESEYLFNDASNVEYDGDLSCEKFFNSLSNAETLKELLSPAILVSTVDFLIPASESQRGGHQIAPLLRLFTSDLVLDEPDDFSLEDDPALARLVFFAGMMGSRVLLSSATLPPKLVCYLFESYRNGRTYYNRATNREEDTPIYCMCVDEFGAKSSLQRTIKGFALEYDQYVEKRSEKLLNSQEKIHWADWLVLDEQAPGDCFDRFVETLGKGIYKLSTEHRTRATSGDYVGKTVSAGVIRISNIESLIQIARRLMQQSAKENIRLHYCIYHSQFPLIVRSNIEKELDSLLKRDKNNPESIFLNPIVEKALKNYSEDHHVFIVLATPVAEVGRDHDYDWAIIEPSSMRSIIQMSGRVQRHRKIAPECPNILIVNKNIRAIQNQKVAYLRPGYETDQAESLKGEPERVYRLLQDHDLRNNIPNKFINSISSIARIKEQPDFLEHLNQRNLNFIDIEHLGTLSWMRRFVYPFYAYKSANLLSEVQKQSPFRSGRPTSQYTVMIQEDDQIISLCSYDQISRDFVDTGLLKTHTVETLGSGVSVFVEYSLKALIQELSVKTNLDYRELCKRYSTIQLPENTSRHAGECWFYSDIEGIVRTGT